MNICQFFAELNFCRNKFWIRIDQTKLDKLIEKTKETINQKKIGSKFKL